jgi:lipopolysaccharide cholinephosphotransferase
MNRKIRHMGEQKMKQVIFIQRQILKIVEEFDAFCRKHNIEYCMGGGTLLGAVRHQGFIPWDDDFDVYMTRDNMEQLIRCWHSEKYDLISYKDENYYKPSTPVKIHNPNFRLKEFGDDNCGYPENTNYGIFIDIFPIDSYKNTIFDRLIQKYLGKILLAKHISKFSHKKSLFSLRLAKFIPNFLLDRTRAIVKKYLTSFPGDYVAFGHEVPFNNFFMKSNKFYPLKRYKFEDLELYGPNDYDEYLSQRFGNYEELPEAQHRRAHIIEIYERKKID